MDVRGTLADLCNPGQSLSITELFGSTANLVEVPAAKLEPIAK